MSQRQFWSGPSRSQRQAKGRIERYLHDDDTGRLEKSGSN